MQLQGAVDEPISCDAFIVAQPRGLRNRYAARYSRESLLSKHEEAGALRVNVNRQGEARSTSGKNGARGWSSRGHQSGYASSRRGAAHFFPFASLEKKEKKKFVH